MQLPPIPFNIVLFNFRKGKLVDIIQMPTATITGISFGGPQREILFVVSAQQLFDNFQLSSVTPPNSSNPADGKVFMVTDINAVGRAGRLVSNYF